MTSPLIVASEADGSGLGRFAVELANAIEAAGHPVTMVARAQPLALRVARRIMIAPLPSAPGWRKRVALSRLSLALAAAVLRSAGPGRPVLLIHIAPAVPFSLAAIFAARLRLAPIALSLHDFYPHTPRYPRRLQGLERWLYRLAYRRCRLIVTNNAAQSRRLVSEARVPAHRVCTLFHGAFPLTQAPVETASELRLLVFGALRPYKHILESIHALRLLRAAGYRVTLRIAGAPRPEDADYWARCRAEIPSGDPGFVIEPRFVAEADLAGVLAESDAMLCPYAGFDSQSGVAVMAVSNAVPVIGTAAAAVAHVDLAAAPWPQVADSADAAAIAAAVRGFIAVPAAERRAFARDLQQAFCAAASWDNLAAGYIAAMRERGFWPSPR